MTLILKTLSDIEQFHANNSKTKEKTIGFVPTMGNLHDGHLSLLSQSKEENDISILSIFVNPKQFGEQKDLDSYPRTLKADILKAQELFENSEKKLVILSPESESIIYPKNFKDYVTIERLRAVSEGKTRPGHFDGVATVVKRLFILTKANRAYFGKKDFQQYLLVKEMVSQEKLAIEIIGLPIIREPSGLAMSSRNSRLNKDQRDESLTLSRTLLEVLFSAQSQGLKKTTKLIQKKLEDNRFNYLEVRNAHTFEEANEQDTDLVILGNFQVGGTRLLDNVEVTI
jgi:pantoate--beta-alanine ligase